jgi:hypothetical protein
MQDQRDAQHDDGQTKRKKRRKKRQTGWAARMIAGENESRSFSCESSRKRQAANKQRSITKRRS